MRPTVSLSCDIVLEGIYIGEGGQPFLAIREEGDVTVLATAIDRNVYTRRVPTAELEEHGYRPAVEQVALRAERDALAETLGGTYDFVRNAVEAMLREEYPSPEAAERVAREVRAEMVAHFRVAKRTTEAVT